MLKRSKEPETRQLALFWFFWPLQLFLELRRSFSETSRVVFSRVLFARCCDGRTWKAASFRTATIRGAFVPAKPGRRTLGSSTVQLLEAKFSPYELQMRMSASFRIFLQKPEQQVSTKRSSFSSKSPPLLANNSNAVSWSNCTWTSPWIIQTDVNRLFVDGKQINTRETAARIV